jgi:hypothetical protein
MSTLKPVKAVEDNDGHWYLIPNYMSYDFHRDLQDEDMCDSGKFDEKYAHYMTGGDLNLIQLWAEI